MQCGLMLLHPHNAGALPQLLVGAAELCVCVCVPNNCSSSQQLEGAVASADLRSAIDFCALHNINPGPRSTGNWSVVAVLHCTHNMRAQAVSGDGSLAAAGVCVNVAEQGSM